MLAHKTAIVTGASAGIGRATALALAGEGAALVLQARRRERLVEVAAEITAMGGNAYDVVVVNAGRRPRRRRPCCRFPS